MGKFLLPYINSLPELFSAFMFNSLQKKSMELTAKTKSNISGKQIHTEQKQNTITGTKYQYNKKPLQNEYYH